MLQLRQAARAELESRYKSMLQLRQAARAELESRYKSMLQLRQAARAELEISFAHYPLSPEDHQRVLRTAKAV